MWNFDISRAMMRSPLMGSVRSRQALNVGATAGLLALSACAYVRTPALKNYDLSKGYRFDSLKLSSAAPSKNSDELMVVLAFSGGGTRASSMSYGVLSQLRAIKLHFDPATKSPVACAETESPRCKAMERSLLDEVDVITSVSGGSFTSAYYALYGDSIFNRSSTFQDRYLYHRVQSDLVKEMFYYPKNWKRLRSRIEIAADYYAQNIFGNATFADLERRPRPYLLLNATDASTGGRFSFTQEQFDLLCADMSQIPIVRGVASSSAFPALLNSLTVDSYNAKGGCGYTVPRWETNALQDRAINPARYTRALQAQAFRDPARKHLHLLDGGLADNLGLRGVIESLTSSDRANQTINGQTVTAGWNLNAQIQNGNIKHLIVITVDSRANSAKNWDSKSAGPITLSVVNASAGIPMGNFTTETLQLMRKLVKELSVDFGGEPSLHAMSISLDDIQDVPERTFLNATGTNFELPEFTVNCLMSRSAKLLRESNVLTNDDSVASFASFVKETLKGSIADANVPSPAACTENAGRKAIKSTSHTIDVALRYNLTRPNGNDDIEEHDGMGLNVRVAKPNGFGASFAATWPMFVVPQTINNSKITIGRLRLYGLMAGPIVSRQIGPVELSGGVSAGYAFGSFRTSAQARTYFGQHDMADTRVSSTSTWLAKPNASLWYSLTGNVGVTVSGAYMMARPTLKFDGGTTIGDRQLNLNAFQFSAGLGYRIF